MNSKKSGIRCLDDKDGFFKLMTKEKPNDQAPTMKEQIATENLVKSSYEEFLYNYIKDPE